MERTRYAWINFGSQDTNSTHVKDEKYQHIQIISKILEVHNQDSITTDKTWSDANTGHVASTQVNLETKFDTWYVNTPVVQRFIHIHEVW